MNRLYRYVVEIETDSQDHAHQVMCERLGFDEQYTDQAGVDFAYRIHDWYTPSALSVEDVPSGHHWGRAQS